MENALILNLSENVFTGNAMEARAIPVHSELQELLYNWVSWIITRKFYAAPIPQNILAQMQKDRRAREPFDPKNNAMCAAWNMIMKNAFDTDQANYLPFIWVNLKDYRPGPLKELAYDLKIDVDTVYQRAANASPKYLSMAKKLHVMHCNMQKEVSGYVD